MDMTMAAELEMRIKRNLKAIPVNIGDTRIFPRTMDEVNAIKTILDSSTTMQHVDPVSCVYKSVISGVPIDLDPAILVQTYSKITEASRLTMARDKNVVTRSVLIKHIGPIGAEIRIPVVGIKKVRPFIPEPVRCPNCNRLGHFRRECT